MNRDIIWHFRVVGGGGGGWVGVGVGVGYFMHI